MAAMRLVQSTKTRSVEKRVQKSRTKGHNSGVLDEFYCILRYFATTPVQDLGVLLTQTRWRKTYLREIIFCSVIAVLVLCHLFFWLKSSWYGTGFRSFLIYSLDVCKSQSYANPKHLNICLCPDCQMRKGPTVGGAFCWRASLSRCLALG